VGLNWIRQMKIDVTLVCVVLDITKTVPNNKSQIKTGSGCYVCQPSGAS
jgi:hypothetical protein